MSDIHATAIIDPGAELGEGVTVGPYAVIGAWVRIGDRTTIGTHSCVEGPTEIGADCTVGKHAALGSAPQSMDYAGESTSLVIGEGNWLGDGVNISRGTPGGGGVTRIGDRNYLMAYAHVGHDCSVADEVVIANNTLLGGHVTVEPKANISGQVTIHQYVRVGTLVMVQGGSNLGQDVPPYAWVGGCRARIQGLNRVGMDRSGISRDSMKAVRSAFKRLFRSGAPFSQALDELAGEEPHCEEVAHLLSFCHGSQRGVMRWRQ